MSVSTSRLVLLAVSVALALPASALARGGDDHPLATRAQAPVEQGDATDDAGASTQPGPAREDATGGAPEAAATEPADQGRGTAADRQRQRGRDAWSATAGRRHGRPRTETYDLRGTVCSVDPANEVVVVTVTRTNHGGRGRALVGQSLTVDAGAARLDVADTNGDGSRDLGDVAVGDRVEVRVALPRPLPAAPIGTVAAQRLRDISAR